MKTKKQSTKKKPTKKPTNKKSTKQRELHIRINKPAPTIKELQQKISKGSEQFKQLIDLKNLRKYYLKTLTLLKSYTSEQLGVVTKELDNCNIDITKSGILYPIFESFHYDKSHKPANIRNTKIRKENPNKSLHPCLGEYNVISILGRGEFGTTYLAEKNKKNYAIKEISIINGDYWGNDPSKQLKNIEKEIDMTKTLGRLGIGPTLYDSYTCKETKTNKIYLVMEHMTEGTLFDWFTTNKLTKAHKQQIQDKLKRMHTKKYIHNDLHLQNIFVTKKKGKIEFYLGDFGIGYTPKTLYDTLFINDINQLNYHLNLKTNETYNPIITNLFVAWGLV